MTFKFTSVPTKTLASSITESATSFTLNNILSWDTVTNLTSIDFGTQAYCIMRNAARTRIELMQFDATTIASSSITITRRGLNFKGDVLTEVTAYKLAWTKGDTFVDLGTDTPQMLQLLKEYIDAASIVGAVDASTTAKGIVEVATQAEADAGTAIGATGASLIVTPATLRSQNYNDYVADTGAANAYVITPSPAITAYAAGQLFTFKATNANTGASTVNVSGLGVKSIKKRGTLALFSNDIPAGAVVLISYDGTDFQIVNGTQTLNTQTFTASGTWTKLSGLSYVVVQLWGAGGSGGKDSVSNASGGGGGGYTTARIEASALGVTETVTLNAGGTAVSLNGVGIVGGNSTFGSLLTAYGGGPGASAGAPSRGGGGGGEYAVGTNPTGGSFSGATSPTTPFTATNAQGLWGGGHGGSSDGSISGNGGGALFGGGGGGSRRAAGTNGTGGASTNAGAGGTGGASGTDGVQPSGGGGGSSTGNSGAGALGKCIVTEYYS